MTLHRRTALLIAALGAPPLAGPLGAVPAGVRFQVRREGRPIGTHRVTFADTAEGQVALTEVAIAVRLAGITVFRLEHRFEEVWAGERLLRVTSRLERNGRVGELTARAEGGAVVVRGTAGERRLPADAAPLSWWNPRRLDGPPLFDNETGAALRLSWVRSALPGGGTRFAARGATHVGTGQEAEVREESEGDYATDGTWVGWRTRAEDGSIVTYERA